MDPVIEVKNISKRYKISHERGGYIALRDVLSNVIKKPFSFLKHKTRQIAGFEKKEEFWALKDVNLTINRGEIVGIIGRNGAGKSTLLKILSRITPPTKGEIVIRGRVGSLLEVGTGFHPELTGRENIFLNGAIIGMGREEIIAKFDQIVEFANIEKFLDTPVKYYSSGMFVRLAFSVAAHMEPDILLIDEVLAVGDTKFQQKCLDKIKDVTQNEKRTVIFISHSMSTVQSLCTRTILLRGGSVEASGNTHDVIREYLEMPTGSKSNSYTRSVFAYEADEEKLMQIRKVAAKSKDGKENATVKMGEPFTIEVDYDVRTEIPEVNIVILFINSENERLIHSTDIEGGNDKKKKPGSYLASIEIPGFLNTGSYNVLVVFESGQQTLDKKSDLWCDIFNDDMLYDPRSRGLITPKLHWVTKKIN